MSTMRTYKAGIIIQHNIITGITPATQSPNISARMDIFNTISKTWSTGLDMNTSRAGFHMHTYNNELYAFGGTNGSIFHKTVEKYNYINNEWTFVSSMSAGRCFYQSCINNQYIYIIGGVGTNLGNTYLSTIVERYDASTDTWTTLAPMPQGVAFGNAHYINDKIYVLCGFLEESGIPNDKVFIYDTILNTWSTIDTFTTEELSSYKRVLPFSYVNSNNIYVLGGLFKEIDVFVQPPVVTNYYISSTFQYNTNTNTITNVDYLYQDLPNTRYGGSTVEVANIKYLMGGINQNINTLRIVETIDISASPALYSDLTRIPKGRSAFGSSYIAANNNIYVTGGVVSNQSENYLFVMLDSLPRQVKLNGRQTATVQVRCMDENEESPTDIDVQLIGSTSANEQSGVVLFTNDRIRLNNGYGFATLLPRSEDADAAVAMSDSYDHSYNIIVKGSVLNQDYYGESEPIPPGSAGNDGNFGTSPPDVRGLPDGAKVLQRYTSVISSSEQIQGALVSGGNIGGVVPLRSVNNLSTGRDTFLTYTNTQPWLPVVTNRLANNLANYDSIRSEIQRMEKEVAFGGSPLLDAIDQSLDLFELDVTTAKRLVYVQTDGDENCSHATREDIIAKVDLLTGNKRFPIAFSVFRTVPNSMHLDRSIRDGSSVAEYIANATNSSVQYVITESEVDSYIRGLLVAKGFIGSGLFNCTIDLGEDVRIESILANFDIPDNTSAFWRYSIGNENNEYTLVSERFEPNETLYLYKSNGRYIKFVAEFYAMLSADTYDTSLLVPPKLTSIVVTYHKKTRSYVYMNTDTPADEVHNLIVTLDVISNSGSDIAIGANTEASFNWNQYYSSAKPFMDNNSRIVIPIRQALDPREVYTLEPLIPIDGFIFEAKYGKWASNSVVTIYDERGAEVSTSEYRIFPTKGYVVFNYKRLGSYTIQVRNRNVLSIGVEITNRVFGEPIVISGAGYMYSTLENKLLSQQSNSILPEAINLLLTPQNPTINSTFVALWTFYDLKGRYNEGSKLTWYINSIEQPDIANMETWDNKEWKLAKSGDSVYFTISPVASDKTVGRTVRSVPVKVS